MSALLEVVGAGLILAVSAAVATVLVLGVADIIAAVLGAL